MWTLLDVPCDNDWDEFLLLDSNLCFKYTNRRRWWMHQLWETRNYRKYFNLCNILREFPDKFREYYRMKITFYYTVVSVKGNLQGYSNSYKSVPNCRPTQLLCCVGRQFGILLYDLLYTTVLKAPSYSNFRNCVEAKEKLKSCPSLRAGYCILKEITQEKLRAACTWSKLQIYKHRHNVTFKMLYVINENIIFADIFRQDSRSVLLFFFISDGLLHS
jgi:hypothetical protein